MFTKTILATAAAALLSVGAISAADAGGYQDGYYVTKEISVPKTICKTFYKTVSSYDDYYNLVYKQVPFELSTREGRTRITGTIPATLDAFKIEPPSLFAIPVKNEIPVRVEMDWRPGP